jgi:anthraniloyl-CoA monooxygenase
MRITCVGGGPAGLYFAILMKLAGAEHDVAVLERNPAGITYGWGVVFWDDLLASLQASDPETARAISADCFRWQDQVVDVGGKPAVRQRGYGFSMSRRRLLEILVGRATELGVRVEFERELQDFSGLADSDLIVACDGAGSRMRRLRVDDFKTNVDVNRNKYVWLGTSKVFDSFTFTFAETDAGWIWFHAYGFDSDTSTFIVECSPETWTGLGFHGLGRDESLELLEGIFERQLDGHPLMAGAGDPDRTPWLNFRRVTNSRWHHDNVALMGDAAHTTHFTIGSGTRLALQDAIGLAAKLREEQDVQSALAAYEKDRQATLRGSQREARYSARWFESIPRYIALDATGFATLFGRRRSRLLARTPPRAYYRLYRVAKRLAGPKLRSWLRSRL